MFGDHQKLIRARMEKGDIVLVFGAGANGGSTNRKSEPIKLGNGLAAALCSAMGEPYANEPLADVVSAAEHMLGRDAINKILIQEFRFAKPSPTLTSIFQYTWKRIYTWNYDDALLEASKSSVQRISMYNGMSDSVEDISERDNLQVVYLHGQITALERGIVLSSQDYFNVLQRGGHDWYRKAVQDYRANTVIFVGSTLNEPILGAEIERASRNEIGGSGLAFLVTPDQLSNVQSSSLQQRGIIHVQAKLEDIVTWLGKEFGQKQSPTSALAKDSFFNDQNISRFNIDDISAAQSIKSIKQGILFNQFENEGQFGQNKRARAFLNGFPPTWILASSTIPVRLSQLDELKMSILNAAEDKNELFVTVGQSGSGKTTATMQALLEISREDKFDVFSFESDTRSVSKAVNILSRIGDKPKLVYLPNLFVFGSQLTDDFATARAANVMFVTTARSNEWKENFERHFHNNSSSFSFQRFVKSDYQPLIDRLKAYVPSPSFVKLSHDQQLEKLAKSKNQLLIALREATESKNFDEVIINEFESLIDDDVRDLFIIAGIATLARVGIKSEVAAEAYETIARNRSFQSALGHLEGIVAEGSDGRLVARHEFYVRNILDRVVKIEKTLTIIESMLSIFTKYSIPITKHVSRPDAALFRFLLNHGFLRERSERGGDKYAGLDIYRKFEIRFQLDGHFWLQYGLYYQRLQNREMAIDMLEKSVAAFPGNPFAIHALAYERLLQAGSRPLYDQETRNLISLSTKELERLHSNPIHDIDQYPLVTLARHHIPVLLKHNQTQVAIELAKDYYERLRIMEKIVTSQEIRDSKGRLLKLVTSGIWEAH